MIEWYLMKYFNIFILREWLTNIFGTHYPKEIVMIIMTIIPRKIRISCGIAHTIILYKDKIYVWGSNCEGQLGLGDYITRISPTEIALRKHIKSIVCGWDITIALISNSKELYVWGCNDDHELSSIYGQTICSPTKLVLSFDSNIKSIRCGQSYTFVLLQSGKCYSWGFNSNGQLGLGHTDTVSSPQEITFLGSDIIEIGCGSGSTHCIAVTKSGKCYTWGCNEYGQLGLGNNKKAYSPRELHLQNIVSIGCGYRHTIVTTVDDKIYTWGSNQWGQLGLGHDNNKNSPQELLFPNIKIKSVSCGFNHTMGLTTSGKLYVWGKNDTGQLGLGDVFHRNFPQEVYLKEYIKSIHGGDCHTICMTHNDKIYSWGCNEEGQLGLGDKECRSKPCELKFFS